MNTVISATARTGRRVRRSLRRFIKRLTRKAVIELTVTVSLPPFLKIVVGYEAKPNSAANDNRPCRRPRRSAERCNGLPGTPTAHSAAAG